MLYAATTFKFTFDYHENDIYWCTADVGWITGHTYVCYGPLTNGATSVIVSRRWDHGNYGRDLDEGNEPYILNTIANHTFFC